MFGDAIFGELIFGGGSLSASSDPDDPIVNVIVNDITGRITYLQRSSVRVLNENSYVEVISPERSWVKILK